MEDKIKLGHQQQEAVELISDWYKSQAPDWFYLAGLAGTGKSTILLPALKRIGLDLDRVAFAAFTGKAAKVMRSKGLDQASTIHSLIYTPVEHEYIDRQGKHQVRVEFVLTGDLTAYDLIVLDEVSMVDDTTARDLLSFSVPILVLGDPGQLAPVKGHGYFTSRDPDYQLTEIHRQALDNPLIAASLAVRDNPYANLAKFADGEHLEVISAETVSDLLLSEADQIIVGKHITRKAINNRIKPNRRWPQAGDKLVGMMNNNAMGFVNGMTYTVKDAERSGRKNRRTLHIELQDDDGIIFNGMLYKGNIESDYDELSDRQAFLDRRYKFTRDEMTMQATWGYAITCHKSQGSEWPHVIVWDDGWGMTDEDRSRWLYTALTRASNKVTIVK